MGMMTRSRFRRRQTDANVNTEPEDEHPCENTHSICLPDPSQAATWYDTIKCQFIRHCYWTHKAGVLLFTALLFAASLASLIQFGLCAVRLVERECDERPTFFLVFSLIEFVFVTVYGFYYTYNEAVHAWSQRSS